MTDSNPVIDQYSIYPYPEPAEDLPAWLQTYHYNPYMPDPNAAQFWPEGRPRAKLNILVAGCGTMQGAAFAYLNPKCNVTGVDFSPASIAHEEKLRARYKLGNLSLHVMDLCDVGKLEQKFDYIVCSGVLHHMPDPAAGAKALASVLEPAHGVMTMMLYGRFGRSGIYALQDAFRRLRIPHSPEGVAQVRDIIRRLPRHHPGRWYFENSPEMHLDAAIVDTFLHRQDVAYSVAEVLDFVEANGLRFQGWIDPAKYAGGLDVAPADIPDRDRWSIAENFCADLTTHVFVTCRPERDPRSRIGFDDDQWLGCFPRRHPALRQSEWQDGKFVRDSYDLNLQPGEIQLAAEANGKQPAAAILKHKVFAQMPEPERQAFARDFYGRMLRLGHIFLSRVPVG
ncbi:MAG: class I SAM-dependent methyltransferase [Pseudolabrys sp.]